MAPWKSVDKGGGRGPVHYGVPQTFGCQTERRLAKSPGRHIQQVRKQVEGRDPREAGRGEGVKKKKDVAAVSPVSCVTCQVKHGAERSRRMKPHGGIPSAKREQRELKKNQRNGGKFWMRRCQTCL